jgi:hypothetical protein
MSLVTARHQVPQLYVVSEEPDQIEGSSFPWGWLAKYASTYAALLAFASLVAWGWQPSLRFQPSVVGTVWACVFLSGYMLGGIGRGQFRYLLLSALLAYLSWLGFRSLTDLGVADCTVLLSVLMVGGWAAARWKGVEDPSHEEQPRRSCGQFRLRWSIWDIGFFTTIAACLVQAIPRMVTPWELMLAVASALLAGLLLSWIACCWAWRDQWDWWSISILIATVVVGLVIVQVSAPTGLALWQAMQWALSGPINVIASQGVVVLAVLFVWRLERLGKNAKSLAS